MPRGRKRKVEEENISNAETTPAEKRTVKQTKSKGKRKVPQKQIRS